ncbi:MAG: DUF4259 domain-containing protein [Nitrospira sp. CR1.1]|nr:DUF4259 domain-containing protein [Nitrospira sp. CR1.1]
MSIWGHKPSQNDDASDWLNEFLEAPSLDLLEEALLEVANPAHVGYIEIPEGGIAIVAAEVLAQILGAHAEDPTLKPDEVLPLVDLVEDVEPLVVKRLVDQALVAVQRVMHDAEHSEMRQVYDEDESGAEEWLEETQALVTRLQSVRPQIEGLG